MYTLNLTEEDTDTIAFVGMRYMWSEALEDMLGLEPQVHDIPEYTAQALNRAFELDDALFPMLDPNSSLYAKLVKLMEDIV